MSVVDDDQEGLAQVDALEAAGHDVDILPEPYSDVMGHAGAVVLLGVVQNILDLENAPNYWIDAIDGAVILLALILARVIGGEASAE